MAGETPVLSDLSGYVNRVATLLRLDATLLAIETKQNLQSVAVSFGLLAAAAGRRLYGRRYPALRDRPASYSTRH